MKRLIMSVFLIISIVGVGLYLLRTMDVVTPKNVVEIIHPEGVIDNGLLSRVYYMNYDLVPTDKTQPGKVYRVIIDNGSVRQEDKIFWSQLELDIGQMKSISHVISQEEFTSLGLYPQYEMTVTEVRSERDGNYLMWPVVYIGIMALVGMAAFNRLKLKRRLVYN